MSEIIITNPKDLTNLMKEIIDEKMTLAAQFLKSTKLQDAKPLTTKQAMEYLSMPNSTFYRYVNEGQIPQYGIGNRRYYKKEELDKLLIKIN